MRERLVAVPVDFEEANTLVRRWHRHHGPVAGHKLSIGVMVEGAEDLCGVAVLGRPLARGLDNGWTAEVLRVATDGTRNACSFLYGAAARAAAAMGYRRVVTYGRMDEPGTSLKAAGFAPVSAVRGRSWSSAARPRARADALVDRVRWERVLADGQELVRPVIAVRRQVSVQAQLSLIGRVSEAG